MNYIREDVLPNVGDESAMLVGAAGFLLLRDHSIMDRVMSTELVKTIAHESGGTYEIEAICMAAKDAVREFGAIELTIPKVPLLSKHEAVLKFHEQDIERLMERIRNG